MMSRRLYRNRATMAGGVPILSTGIINTKSAKEGIVCRVFFDDIGDRLRSKR